MDDLKISWLGITFLVLGILIILLATQKSKSLLLGTKIKAYTVGIVFVLFGTVYVLNDLGLW